MIGLFIKNKQNEICFIKAEKTATDISSFHYTSDAKILLVNFSDGTDQVFLQEIVDDIHQSFLLVKEILVLETDEKGEPEKEYTVALTKI